MQSSQISIFHNASKGYITLNGIKIQVLMNASLCCILEEGNLIFSIYIYSQPNFNL